MEEWRAINGFDGYEVSNLGNVRSWLLRGYGTTKASEPHPMKARTINGYARITFGTRVRPSPGRYVHRLVLEAFVGPAPKGTEACHNNGNRLDNRVENLRWDTRKNNHADKVAHGTAQRGERSGMSKLTTEQIRAIRTARSAGEGIVSLGRKYGVAHSHISRICLNKVWNHLE